MNAAYRFGWTGADVTADDNKDEGADEETFISCKELYELVRKGARKEVARKQDGTANIVLDKYAWRIFGQDLWVEVVDATGIDRYNIFDNCFFTNTSSTALTSGFVIPAGMGAPRRLFLKDCVGFGASKWDANDRGILMGNMGAVTAADLSGVMVEMVE